MQEKASFFSSKPQILLTEVKLMDINIDEQNNYDIDLMVCSARDCTGLIPALPETEAELEFYQELYPYHVSQKVVETAANQPPQTSPVVRF